MGWGTLSISQPPSVPGEHGCSMPSCFTTELFSRNKVSLVPHPRWHWIGGSDLQLRPVMREQTEPERFQSFIPKRSYGQPCPPCVGDPGKACLLAASHAHAQGSASPPAFSMHYYYHYDSSHCHRQQSAVGTITNEPKHLKGKWRNEMCLELWKELAYSWESRKPWKHAGEVCGWVCACLGETSPWLALGCGGGRAGKGRAINCLVEYWRCIQALGGLVKAARLLISARPRLTTKLTEQRLQWAPVTDIQTLETSSEKSLSTQTANSSISPGVVRIWLPESLIYIICNVQFSARVMRHAKKQKSVAYIQEKKSKQQKLFLMKPKWRTLINRNYKMEPNRNYGVEKKY